MAHPIVHFEIGCRDKTKTSEFYAKLFGWSMKEEGPATMISTGEKDAITGHITALGHEPHNYVTVYVRVNDVKAELERAKSLGGKMLVPPIEIPSGTFAWMGDPEGNIIGLFKPNH